MIKKYPAFNYIVKITKRDFLKPLHVFCDAWYTCKIQSLWFSRTWKHDDASYSDFFRHTYILPYVFREVFYLCHMQQIYNEEYDGISKFYYQRCFSKMHSIMMACLKRNVSSAKKKRKHLTLCKRIKILVLFFK